MRKILFPLVAAGFGTGCPVQFGQSTSSEVRIDGAGEFDRIDSHSTRSCVAPDGDTYVVWIDDRNGTPELWFNRKLAGDERLDGWFPQPVPVSSFAGSNIWKPAIACTDSGVYVVWEDDRDGEVESHNIYFQRSVDGGQTWMPEDRLLEEDEEGRSNSFDPDIVVDGPNVYVVWSDNVNGAFDILFARSTDSGITFQPPMRIDSDQPPGSAYSAFPRLATGFDGEHVYVTWQDFRNGGSVVDGGSDVYFARSTDKGQSFGSDVRLDTGEDPGRSDSFVPRIAADDDEVYVVWHDDRNGDGADVLMNHSSDGGVTWAAAASRADAEDTPGRNQSVYPSLCVVGDEAHVVWHDDRHQGFQRVFYNRAEAGSWVGPEVRLDANKADGQRASRDTRIACDGANVAAAWLDETRDEGDDGYNDVAYNYSADGGQSWRVPTSGADREDTLRLDSNRDLSFKEDLTIHLSGARLQATWTDGRGGSTDVFYQQVDASQGPPVPYLIPDADR